MSGLVDWLRLRALREGKLSPSDLELIRVTDEANEVVSIVSQAWTQQTREASA